jgi:transposase-like protein
MLSKDELLQTAKRRELHMRDLERDLESAKEDYHQSIRDLHINEMSLREIASQLNLSHQRVHQIVESSNPSWRFWLSPVKQELACSFCAADNEQVNKLVAGTNIYICDRCAKNCAKATLSGNTAHSPANKLRVVHKTSKVRCSFCGKLPNSRRSVVAAEKHQICSKCLDMTLRLMAES